jgi:uncharacterized protein YpuA (DUF1002 family)
MPKLVNNIIFILTVLIMVNSTYADKKQVDPTMPKSEVNINKSTTEQQEGGGLVLTAILTSLDNNTAIINNKLLHEKEQIAEYQLIKIESNKVILKDINKNTIELKLPEITIKK